MVFKAWDPKLDRTVVVKQVSFNVGRQSTGLAKLRDRLYREARAAGKLNHPNIIVIYDVEEEPEFSYIVMEYLEGRDLRDLLDQAGPIPLNRAVNIVRQICSALSFAHANGIIHRDIKPSNIMLSNDNRVKVADFGIAKLPQFGTLTNTGDIVGTPFYMSPEQIEGRRLGGSSDIFSTAVLFYEMLTGIRPFAGDNIPSVVYKIVHKVPKAPSRLKKTLPSQLDEVFALALAKEARNRYQTPDEFIADLEKVVGENS